MFNFRRKKHTSDVEPKVQEIKLSKEYRFMYENCVFCTQHYTYLLLEKNGDEISALKFDSSLSKYGYPNDESRGGHSLSNHGLGFYGLFEVHNSPWIKEVMIQNRIHPQHNDSMYDSDRHFIACFKDVTLEVISSSFEEIQLPTLEFMNTVTQELNYLNINN